MSLHPQSIDHRSADELERAARATVLALLALILASIALALFFGGVGSIFGPINDVLLGAMFVLLLPAIISTRRSARRPWFTALSIIGIIGIVELVIGQLLLVTGVISLQASFATLGIGFLAFAAWGSGLAILSLRRQMLSPAVGWWAVAFAVTLALAAVAWEFLPLAAWSVFGLALLIAFSGWLASVAGGLKRASSSARSSGA
jgi:hypothetical protein